MDASRESLFSLIIKYTSWPSLLFSFFVLYLSMSKLTLQVDNWPVTAHNYKEFTHDRADSEHVAVWQFVVWGIIMCFVLGTCEHILVKAIDPWYTVFAFNVAFVCGEGFAWTNVFTELLKYWVAEPRPDFIDRCLGSPDVVPEFDDRGHIVCVHDVHRDRKSFPSGHSSNSIYVGVFCTAYLVWTLYVRREELPWTTAGGQWASALVVQLSDFLFIFTFSPLLLGGYIACSRLVDHRHSPADVTAGSLIGLIFGLSWFGRLVSKRPSKFGMPGKAR